MRIFNCDACCNDASDVCASIVWSLNFKESLDLFIIRFSIIFFKKVNKGNSFNIKNFKIFQAGITKLVNGAGLYWTLIFNSRTQDQIMILPVD